MTTTRPTATQRKALAMIAAEGTGYPGSADFTMATARALFAKGLIEVKDSGRMISALVHGPFGRGYTTRQVATGISVQLTDAGRTALEV